MQRLEVSGVVRPLYGSLGVKRLKVKVKNIIFYIHGSVHRESNLITVQQDATYSVYHISVGSSTCFGC